MTTDQSKSGQYCIVGTGRSGSSFLANILAHSGADFGLPPVTDGNPKTGYLEHPLTHHAYATLHKIQKIKASLLPNGWLVPRYESRLKSQIDQLVKVPFLKSSKLVYLVPHMVKQGAKVKVIIIFRNFTDYAASRHKKFGWDMATLEAEYINAYRTALLQCDIWGGVVISYDELVQAEQTAWATRLAEITGLTAVDILQTRTRLLTENPVTSAARVVPYSDAVKQTESVLQQLTK